MARNNQWPVVSPVDDNGDPIGVPFLGTAASAIGPFTATTTSRNAPISGLTAGGQVRIVADTDVRIEFGSANTVAATTPAVGALTGSTYAVTAGSRRVKPGIEVLSAPVGTTHVAFKTDTGTAVVEFDTGKGS